jgi:hypothetical protein
MLLKFFNRNQPLLSFSFVILTAIAYFFIPENPDSKWFLWFGQNENYFGLYKAFYAIFLLICAQLITMFINESAWLKDGFSYLPGLVFIILGLPFASIINLEALVLVSIVLGCQFIFSASLGKQRQITRAFQMGFLVGLGILTDVYFSLFGLVALIFWHYQRSYYWRETVWFVIGALIPSYLLIASFYIFSLPHKSIFILSVEPSLRTTPALLIYASLTLALTILGMLNLYKRATRNTLRSRQVAGFFMGSSIVLSIYLLLNSLANGNYINLGLLTFPVASFISVLFFNPSKARLANLVFYLWAIISFVVGLGIF